MYLSRYVRVEGVPDVLSDMFNYSACACPDRGHVGPIWDPVVFGPTGPSPFEPYADCFSTRRDVHFPKNAVDVVLDRFFTQEKVFRYLAVIQTISD